MLQPGVSPFVLSGREPSVTSRSPSSRQRRDRLGQRAGTAIGTAAAVSTFYSVIAGRSEGSTLDIYHEAYRSGFLVTIALVAGALVLALLDLRARKQGRVGEAADAS